MSTEDYFRAGN